MKPKVLFIGGTGTISSACTALALDQGAGPYPLNPGTPTRDVPHGAQAPQAAPPAPHFASESRAPATKSFPAGRGSGMLI